MRGLLVTALAGAFTIGLVSPAQAPNANAFTLKQHYGFSASEGALRAYKHYAWVRLGRDGKAFGCLNRLWTAESNWRPRATAKVPVNGKYAGGIPQLIGLNNKRYNAYTQIELGLIYLNRRYDGSPCQAWAHWQKQKGKRGYGWY